MSTRTLVVDDSASFGSVIRRALEAIAGVEVIGRCVNGREALQRIQAEAPDLVTLDIEMPEMNGLDVLRAIRRQSLKTTVIVLSAAGTRARELTIQALELGALDFVTKPDGESAAENLAALHTRLAPLLVAAGYRKEVQILLRGETPVHRGPAADKPVAPAFRPAPDAAGNAALRRNRWAGRAKPAMVLIGASTGGTEALAHVIPQLPAELNLPVLIVQHMPPLFTQALANSLNARSALEVREAQDGETATAGHVYIAPGGSHLKVTAGPGKEIGMRITTDPPENNCRPAVDYLFRSAALAFPGRAVVVILTGMGRDGTLGLRLLKAGGCLSIAQNEATCAVFGMPKEAIHAGVVDVVAPLDSIAAEIVKAVR
jgi:two-component system chemotaxis response regulator CheB